MRTTCIAVALLLAFAHGAAAQDQPTRARFVGPDWLIGGGVLRCDVNDQWQLVVEAKTAKLQNADLKQFRPVMSSSNEGAVQAVVEEDPNSTQVLCAGDGRAEVTLTVGDLTLCIPVLSGSAKNEDSAPCSSGYTLVATSSGPVQTQAKDKPVRARFLGPDWLIGKGVLGCEANTQWQLVLEAKTAKLQPADLKYYPPRVSSTNESVARAVLDADPNSLQIHCGGSGRSEVSVKLADVTICIPVVVGGAAGGVDTSPCGATMAAADEKPSSAAQPPQAQAQPPRTPEQPPRAQQQEEPARAPEQPEQPPVAIARDTTSKAPLASSGAPIQKAPPQTAAGAARDRAGMAEDPIAAAPADFAAQYVSSGRIVLAWAPVPGATSYDILYTQPGGAQQYGLNLEPITQPQHVSRQVTEGTYVLTVRANMAGGEITPASTPVSVTVPRWLGKYRVTLNGFRVNRETADHMYEIDGKRDEIFVRTAAQLLRLGQEIGGPEIKQTLTHGDVNAQRWQDGSKPTYRIKAGTASALGGLLTGDGYPDRMMPWKRASATNYNHTFPLLVWEGELIEDYQNVVIAPAIYEDDEKELEAFAEVQYLPVLKILATLPQYPYKFQLGPNNTVAVVKPIQVVNAVHNSVSNARDHATQFLREYPEVKTQLDKIEAAYQTIAPTVNLLTSTINISSNLTDRPIGLFRQTNGQHGFEPAPIFLTFGAAEQVIAGSGPGVIAPGIIAVDYKDTVAGGNGDYTLFIEVQRVQ